MWWRIDSAFFRGEIAKIAERAKKHPRDNTYYHGSIIRLITDSLDAPLAVVDKRDRRIFDILVEHGILREKDGGFSAYEWLLEQGRVGEIRKRTPLPKAPKGQAQKVYVRENVALSEGEIESLERSHSSGELEQVYDKLSAYKRTSCRTYQSDYRAILSWVLDAVSNDAQVDAVHNEAQAARDIPKPFSECAKADEYRRQLAEFFCDENNEPLGDSDGSGCNTGRNSGARLHNPR